MKMHERLLITLGLLATLLGGAAQAGEKTIDVEMRDYGYHPAELEITVGTTVRWVNVEKRTSHDVFFPAEEIASGRLFPEESWERTFDEAGIYEYRCQPHENRDMRGVIRVVAE
ncbi:plastocyanin [Halomonas sp. MCCC 1A11036]|uniref:Plastocyanin n=1 Tax=Billgrantia zhangzhouensis TaxID=2733481 RepID=A0ABS9AJ41_9GAMM|nr:plastocyanin/azurin family copper-binding protein [Halomonas zhangzhouensis]MCE8021780.1 plastocyanin [Halomonas zhangzhouensis]